MAVAKNARDLLLAAASVRIIPTSPGVTSSYNIFKQDKLGNVTPSNIVLNSNVKSLPAPTYAWYYNVGAGDVLISGATSSTYSLGNTTFLGHIGVKTSVTYIMKTTLAGNVLQKSFVIYLVKDGADGLNGTNGTNGTNGVRGTVQIVVTDGSFAGSWGSSQNSAAYNGIISATGTAPINRDMVTIRNTSTNPTYVETRFYDAGSWLTIGQYIPGNLLVSGTVSSDAISTNTLTAVTINTSGTVKSTGATTTDQGGVFASIVGIGGGQGGVYGSSADKQGVWGHSPLGSGVFGTGYNGGSFSTTNAAGTGIYVVNGGGGTAITMSGKLQWGPVLISTPPNNTTQFLRADGTWAAPSGSSGVTSFNTRTGAVKLSYSDVDTAVAGNTLAVNVTGNAGSANTATTASNANALDGSGPNSWLRFITTSGASKSFAGYMQVQANGTTAWIPLYV